MVLEARKLESMVLAMVGLFLIYQDMEIIT